MEYSKGKCDFRGKFFAGKAGRANRKEKKGDRDMNMTTIKNRRKSLDELEKECWAPAPSMLEEPPVWVALDKEPPGELKERGFSDDEEKEIALNGLWEMAWDGEESERLSGRSWEGSIPAQIPCSVHTALFEAGIIPDPTVGLQDAIAREYCYKTWWFKKEFDREPESAASVLCFEGVCHYGKVWLNGCYLGEHKGMFGSFSFDVSGILRERNVLIVKIENSPDDRRPMSEYMDNDEGWHDGVVINCVYGWHYACLPSRGIWMPVSLREKERTIQCEKPLVSCRDAEKGIVDICMKINRQWGRAEICGKIEGKNHDGAGGTFVYTCEGKDGGQVVHLQTQIQKPRLWWPTDLGEHNLYTLTMTVKDEAGSRKRFVTTFGLRTIEMAPLPGGPYEDLHNWTFVINKKPVFIKGTNWCTLDVLLRFRKETYRRFLSLAGEQHVQLLRAWGGGMPESETFYDLCDELGIMVMQEWPTCWDSQKKQPIAELEDTVLTHMPRLRNHPSLIMWCGGNESAKADGEAMDMMARYAYELDGSRCFHRTSPWGGALHNYSTYWDRQDIDVSLNLRSHFMGEFGMASAPNIESVARYVPAQEMGQWPPERFGSFGHHTPRFNQLEPNDMEHLGKRVPEFAAGDTMESFIWATQMAQATAIRHTLEAYRTRWPMATGICYYKLTDVYPACSWSTIDYYGVPKLSYYVIKDSYQPLHACLLFKTMRICEDRNYPVYLLDDAGCLKGKEWKVYARAYNEKLAVISERIFEGSGSGEVAWLGYLPVQTEQAGEGPVLFTAEVFVDGEKADGTFYWANYHRKTGSLLTLPQTKLAYSFREKNGKNQIGISNTGKVPAAGVTIECPARDTSFAVEDSMFWLNPGEERWLNITDTEGLRVKAWNVPKAQEKLPEGMERVS